MGTGIFVTATGTEVGKTYVSAAIIKKLKQINFNGSIAAFKPIATGNREDAVKLGMALNLKQTKETLQSITPVLLKYPLSPYASLKLKKEKLNIAQVIKKAKEIIKNNDFTVIEGIGGLMVPIKKNYFVTDMIKDINCPVVLVCDAKLGTINHILLSLENLYKNKIKVKGIIVNNYTGKTLDEKTNIPLLKEFTKLPIGVVSKNGEISDKDLKWIIKK